MGVVEMIDGFSVGGRNQNNIRYADDTVLIEAAEENLQELVIAMNMASEAKGLRTKREKTKCMVLTKRSETQECFIRIQQELVKKMDQFSYLGSVLTADGRCDTEIRRRIRTAKTAYRNMSNMLTSSRLSIKTRKRTIKRYVWSTML